MNQRRPKYTPSILLKFAELLGTDIINGRINIPPAFGTGYCAGFVFNEHIRLLISHYELKEEIKIDNPDLDADKRVLFFKFQNIFPKAKKALMEKQSTETPSVLIATSRVNTDEVIAIHTNTETIMIEVDADYLSNLFNHSISSPILQSLLANTQPLLFEQIIYPSLQKIVDEIIAEPVSETFQLFFLRVKAEELICKLLMELEKRDEKQLYPLNVQDIQTLYKVRAQLLEHLDLPPVINELAVGAGMSPTKLKRSFKQIFGTSIFSYYQQFRMKEASLLLKDEKLSVSDVGYKLGFTNLSHFSRVFQAHLGVKPKQYSLTAKTLFT